MAVDPDQIAQAFVAHYYASFDAEATRPTLAALYQPQSMLTFEGAKLQARLLVVAGGDAIVQKLVSLPFKSCQHKITTCDAQPSPSGGILVFVSGDLLPEGESRPQKFSQVFHLMPAGASWFVFNDLFRLNYG